MKNPMMMSGLCTRDCVRERRGNGRLRRMGEEVTGKYQEQASIKSLSVVTSGTCVCVYLTYRLHLLRAHAHTHTFAYVCPSLLLSSVSLSPSLCLSVCLAADRFSFVCWDDIVKDRTATKSRTQEASDGYEVSGFAFPDPSFPF